MEANKKEKLLQLKKNYKFYSKFFTNFLLFNRVTLECNFHSSDKLPTSFPSYCGFPRFVHSDIPKVFDITSSLVFDLVKSVTFDSDCHSLKMQRYEMRNIIVCIIIV